MKKSLYFWGTLFLSFALFVFSQFCKEEMTEIAACMIVVGLLVVGFISYQQRFDYRGKWYKPSNLFILSYIIVNFQYIIDLLLGLKSRNDFLYPMTINEITVIGVLGMLAFCLGYYLNNRKGKKNRIKHNRIGLINTKFLAFFQVSSLILWIFTVEYQDIIGGIAYVLSNQKDTSNRFEDLFYFSSFALLITIIYNSRAKQRVTIKNFFQSINIFCWISMSIYGIIRIISGDRGPFIYLSLAVFYAYICSSHQVIRLRVLLIVVLSSALFINVIGIARSSSLQLSFMNRFVSAYDELSSSENARFSEQTVFVLTEELATSVRCNQIAVEKICYHNYSYHYGMYSFYQLIQCIPYVPSFLRNNLKIDEYELSANILMTDDYLGGHDKSQLGTTIIADSYWDFGRVGVFLMLLFVGYCFKFIDYGICISSPKNILPLCCVVVLAAMSLYMPRSTFFIQFKSIVPILVIFYLNLLIGKKRIWRLSSL